MYIGYWTLNKYYYYLPVRIQRTVVSTIVMFDLYVSLLLVPFMKQKFITLCIIDPFTV